MKFVLLIMLNPSILSLKLVWNEVVSLHFEEVITKKSEFQCFLKFFKTFETINIFQCS